VKRYHAGLTHFAVQHQQELSVTAWIVGRCDMQRHTLSLFMSLMRSLLPYMLFLAGIGSTVTSPHAIGRARRRQVTGGVYLALWGDTEGYLIHNSAVIRDDIIAPGPKMSAVIDLWYILSDGDRGSHDWTFCPLVISAAHCSA